MPVNRDMKRLEDENKIKDWKRANRALQADLDEAASIIKQLARLIAGRGMVVAVPVELQRRAEEFGADFSG